MFRKRAWLLVLMMLPTSFKMKKPLYFLSTLFLAFLSFVVSAEGSRIKDITTVEGLRDNQLIGYGIVVGLSGTGDSSLAYTNASITNTLKHFGINPENADSKNIAAVMVTTDIAPFTKPGSRIDVTVSSIGNCKTLQGGVLLQTPLEGADEIVYAVAQGPLAVGGFLGGTSGGEGQGSASVQQNHPTVARIAGGAIVEREIITDLGDDHTLGLILRNPDYTCAVRIADVLNRAFSGIAKAENPNLVHLNIPEEYQGQAINFLALIGELEVFPDLPARIIINERTGTIVATANVRLSRVAVSHGSLTISISSTAEASQPAPLSQTGDTKMVNNSQVSVNEVKGGFQVLGEFPSIERLTSALNALGVSSREMMSILQSIKNAGALQAELIVN